VVGSRKLWPPREAKTAWVLEHEIRVVQGWATMDVLCRPAAQKHLRWVKMMHEGHPVSDEEWRGFQKRAGWLNIENCEYVEAGYWERIWKSSSLLLKLSRLMALPR
jgi:hypothetical protein